MKFTIEFNPTEFAEIIKNGTLMALAETVSKTDVSALAAAQVIKSEQEARKQNQNTAQESAEEIKPATKTEEQKEAPAYTMAQVKEKLTGLTRAGKQAQVKALIEKFGATKLSEIKEADYAALMQEAEGI
jgi:23S rRNA maturation-related 3'-5' exoribonuclease YhaM